MKHHNQLRLFSVITGFILLTTSCAVTRLNSKTSDTDFSALIHDRNFVFEADRAIAQSGFTKFLTSDYHLTVSKDTLKAWLPYYGRTYRAPMDPTDGGITFTTTHFDYQVTEGKKDSRRIEIGIKKPHEETDKMILTVFPDGNASLIVRSTFRQSITFQGKIREPK